MIVINKHIYAILNQNVNLNKLLNETQLQIYKNKFEIFKDFLRIYAKIINDVAIESANNDNVIKN